MAVFPHALRIILVAIVAVWSVVVVATATTMSTEMGVGAATMAMPGCDQCPSDAPDDTASACHLVCTATGAVAILLGLAEDGLAHNRSIAPRLAWGSSGTPGRTEPPALHPPQPVLSI